ncbi:MAG: serine hydroxymethyltransferase [Candidatus Dormibacteraeota bacterium]|jgi:glycine hydroxymethyltransferase|nr:serine hydroxymethyltransferase [Candidatus Dormibacteraeota bacterium]
MAASPTTTLTFEVLDSADPEIAELIRREYRRQSHTLELIPSENLASAAILEALGTLLTNKYAEGYPGRRYYGGCEVMDQIETLAQERARRLFGAAYVNVQPHAGSQANAAVYAAICKPGDRVMGMDLSAGGHLTHGSPANFSGKLYEIHSYLVDRETELIDYDALQRQAEEVRPKMLMVGYSAYPRRIDFARMREIADSVEAVMVTDMAHFAGLVAGDAYPTPIPDSHVVTSTTQKTLRGAWGGLILAADEERWRKPLDSAVFPGTQGGPLMHAIAAKAVCFGEALKPEFKDYAGSVVENARAMAARLMERGLRLTTGGTDNHLMLVDLRPLGLKGRQVQDAADRVGITLNSNAIPYDEASKFNPSGIRLGSPSVTTRGMGVGEMAEIGDCVADLLEALAGDRGEAELDAIRERTLTLTNRFPLPYALS